MQLTLPLVGRVVAGSPVLAVKHTDRQYQVDPSLSSAQPGFPLKVCGTITCDVGIPNGDPLAIRRVSGATNGKIVMAQLGDDVTVKCFQHRDRHVELIAENPDFEPIRVDLDRDEFHPEGLAVGLTRSVVP